MDTSIVFKHDATPAGCKAPTDGEAETRLSIALPDGQSVEVLRTGWFVDLDNEEYCTQVTKALPGNRVEAVCYVCTGKEGCVDNTSLRELDRGIFAVVDMCPLTNDECMDEGGGDAEVFHGVHVDAFGPYLVDTSGHHLYYVGRAHKGKIPVWRGDVRR